MLERWNITNNDIKVILVSNDAWKYIPEKFIVQNNELNYIQISNLTNALSKLYYNEIDNDMPKRTLENFFGRLRSEFQEYYSPLSTDSYVRIYKSVKNRVIKFSSRKEKGYITIIPNNNTEQIEVIKILLWITDGFNADLWVRYKYNKLIKILGNLIKTIRNKPEEIIRILYGKEISEANLLIESEALLNELIEEDMHEKDVYILVGATNNNKPRLEM